MAGGRAKAVPEVRQIMAVGGHLRNVAVGSPPPERRRALHRRPRPLKVGPAPAASWELVGGSSPVGSEPCVETLALLPCCLQGDPLGVRMSRGRRATTSKGTVWVSLSFLWIIVLLKITLVFPGIKHFAL